MSERIRMMPQFMGAGMVGLTAAFDLYGLLRTGRRFRKQRPEQRRAQLAQWKHGPVGLGRSFVDFYEKMGIFVYYSRMEEE